MPFPSPSADGGPIDLEYLRRSTLGDTGLEREVLEMFAKQASRIVGALAAIPPDAGALVHTLKGSARAIGATGVADRARLFEVAISEGGDRAQAQAELDAAVAEACAAIEAILARP
jgi:HPt (histidine-containing phosphotransfer) domain-containing protein